MLFMRVRKAHASLNSFHCLKFRLWLQLWRGGKASLSDLCTNVLCWRFVIFPSSAELNCGTHTACFSCNSLWRCRSRLWKMALRTSIQNASRSYYYLEKQPKRHSLKTLPHRVCSGRSWWYMWEQFKRFPPPTVYSTVYVSLRKSDGRVNVEFRLWTKTGKVPIHICWLSSWSSAYSKEKNAKCEPPDMNDQRSFGGI